MALALLGSDQAPVPPPSYHRTLTHALHLDALTVVTRLRLLSVCRLAVRLAEHQCPPPLPAGRGGAPCVYTQESLLLPALLSTLWRLSYQAAACAPDGILYQYRAVEVEKRLWHRRARRASPLHSNPTTIDPHVVWPNAPPRPCLLPRALDRQHTHGYNWTVKLDLQV